MKATQLSRIIALALFTLSFGAAAQAPTKVGDLIDKGGVKLSKDDAGKLVSGATTRGTAVSSSEFRVETSFKADGSLSGSSKRYIGPGGGTFSGKWSVNDQGQVCADTTNSSGVRNQGCSFFFKLGNAYFIAQTDDRSAAVLEREIVR